VLPAEKVQAIVNLVSSSVPDLTPEKVTVADSLGNVLSSGNGQSSTVANGQQLDASNAFDQNVETSIQTLIAASLGPGHSAVNYNATLNFDQTKRTTDSFTNPTGQNGKPLATSSNTSTETYTGNNPNSTGVLGTNTAPTAAGGANTNYKKNDNNSNYAVDQVHEEVNQAPGSITGASIAVLLDSSKVKPADVAQWRQTISAAAGLSTTRGDVISVNLVPFDKTAQQAQAQQAKSATAAKSQDFLLNLVRSLVVLLIVGLVLFLAWRAVKKSAAISTPVRVPLDLRELEAGDLLGNRLEAAYERSHAIAEAANRPSLEASRSPVEDELDDLIQRQPDEVALTLRSWLADRRS
jgi:flagellar M-ring protein FliF